MHKKFAVQIKYQAFSDISSNLVINILTDFKQACDSSYIHEGAIDWLYWDFMNGSALTSIKEQLTRSWNDDNRHKKTIKTYA